MTSRTKVTFAVIGCFECTHTEKRPTFAEADLGMLDHYASAHIGITRPVLPKAAADLVACAAEHGWRIAAGYGRDSGNAPFVEIQLANDDPKRLYKICWHTRDTGTYRLFSKIVWAPYRGWTDAPSIRAIRAFIAEPEAVSA